MKRVSVTTPAGILLDDRVAGHWPADAHDPVITKMIRGLYFHHFGEILGDKASTKVHWLRYLNSELRQLWTELPLGGALANEIFLYRCGNAVENPLYSVWMFVFYGRHFASGYTSPISEAV